jgi:hypothetical protein
MPNAIPTTDELPTFRLRQGVRDGQSAQGSIRRSCGHRMSAEAMEQDCPEATPVRAHGSIRAG